MIRIKTKNKNCLPEVGSEYSAGLDLRVYLGENPREDMVSIKPGTIRVFDTGLAFAIPFGWVGLIAPRSSTGSKLRCRLTNTVGVIDADYRGYVSLEIENFGKEEVILENFQRICQMVVVPHFSPHMTEVVEDLDSTSRGDGGWGHSGTV